MHVAAAILPFSTPIITEHCATTFVAVNPPTNPAVAWPEPPVPCSFWSDVLLEETLEARNSEVSGHGRRGAEMDTTFASRGDSGWGFIKMGSPVKM